MLAADFSRFVLIPLFVLNMGAMLITLQMKKKTKPEFSGNLNILYLIENIIGLGCAIGLSYIAFFG
ncbi:hypothetical protein E4K67_27435 [Desulfosporosinus fructosivorans]|uniref:Uncharacterized protein n=1 Tax=Desulfosporosinus fructosivorans TaxID=2018669 RepID=A0A4Z0QYD7_9FIRM|nr:hypothetical protein [Desulfosporosinus fructosivorans]TGE35045.1 hypothetical protein E4K67_27435 [Desulfosporosinus fructosivorans]